MEESFWQSNGDWISALITLAVAFAVAFVVDRFVIARATRVASKVSDTSVSRATATRLRMVRRLVFAAIIVIGLGIALSQFDKLNKLANAVLASSAVVGLVLGFAAQKILANPLAGILLAISQPIRIGDTVTIEDETGRVDDLTLSYTFIDTGDGRLVIVPNETVVTNVVVNRSTGEPERAGDGVGLGAPGRRPLRRPRGALAARAVAGRRRRGDHRRGPDRGPRSAPPGRHPRLRRGGGASGARATRPSRGRSAVRRSRTRAAVEALLLQAG